MSEFNQIWSVRKIFAEVPNIKFPKIRLAGAALIFADRQTDRQDEANSCYTLFTEST